MAAHTVLTARSIEAKLLLESYKIDRSRRTQAITYFIPSSTLSALSELSRVATKDVRKEWKVSAGDALYKIYTFLSVSYRYKPFSQIGSGHC